MGVHASLSVGDDLADLEALSDFCNESFGSLGRSDQRRWAELYVRGLLSVPGRKSIRRISDFVVGRDVDQSLQQFVNQSPWQWGPVRHAVAAKVGQYMRPTAWVVQEVVFPKNGESSVGVARQYAPSLGRMLNCQRGLAVFLAGDQGSTAVNWRLVLPRDWDGDADRRAKSRVPDDERSQPAWQYQLDLLDEMVDEWGLAPAPVIVDLTNESDVCPLLDQLEERGLGYLAQVPSTTPALPSTLTGPQGRVITVGQLAAAEVKRGRTALPWRVDDAGGHATRHFVAAAVPVLCAPTDPRRGRPRVPRRRHMLAEWPPGQQRPRGLWLTNLGPAVPDLVEVLRTRDQVREDLVRLTEECGLRHFEGRSFQGWHHHVTLASAAHAYRLVHRLEREHYLARWLRPYA